MGETDWYKCRFLESSENLKPLVQKRFGREPSTSTTREITACLQQGRLFYEAAAASPLEIRPLQLFYGMLGFSKALVVARSLNSLSTLRPAHGLRDISPSNSRIADLRVKIDTAGTFQEFNNVVAELNRLWYLDFSNQWCTITLPSAKSFSLDSIELSLQDILSRIPGLESLYRMTFGEDARTSLMRLVSDHSDDQIYRISIAAPHMFSDRETLRQLVDRLRDRFPFLKKWRLHTAYVVSRTSEFAFTNTSASDIDEFSETNLSLEEGAFKAIRDEHHRNRFTPEQGFQSVAVAGGYTTSSSYAISPVRDVYLSEFSLQYLALFLLSSLVRYRPQTWTQAISGSFVSGETADDKTLSLIERFLEVNRGSIPELVVKLLNPHEDES